MFKEVTMGMFGKAIEKGTPGRKASGEAKAPEPRLHEVKPAGMVALLKTKEFESKGEECTKVQVTSSRWPFTVSMPLAECAVVGPAIVAAVVEKIGKGRKGVGYSADETAARLAKHSRLFSDGDGLCLLTQAWSPSLAVPKGQDGEAFASGANLFLTGLAKGIESGDAEVKTYVAQRTEEGNERKVKSDAKRELEKAARAAEKAKRQADEKAAKA